MLILEGSPLNRIKRTLCWQRLELLHTTLPRQYRDPVVHDAMLRRTVVPSLHCRPLHPELRCAQA
jgi:hypothetical protein